MLVPCYKRARPEVRGLVDPSSYDAAVWALGDPEPSPAGLPAEPAEALGASPESAPAAEAPGMDPAPSAAPAPRQPAPRRAKRG